MCVCVCVWTGSPYYGQCLGTPIHYVVQRPYTYDPTFALNDVTNCTSLPTPLYPACKIRQCVSGRCQYTVFDAYKCKDDDDCSKYLCSYDTCVAYSLVNGSPCKFASSKPALTNECQTYSCYNGACAVTNRTKDSFKCLLAGGTGNNCTDFYCDGQANCYPKPMVGKQCESGTCYTTFCTANATCTNRKVSPVGTICATSNSACAEVL